MEDSNKKSPTTSVAQIIAFIDENLNEIRTIEDIRAAFPMSKAYLCRMFKAATGSTIMHYISDRRIRRTFEYVQCGHGITESCYLVGYQNYSAFYKQFYRKMNMSPTLYVRQMQMPGEDRQPNGSSGSKAASICK